jgi:hypothetical protein
MPAASQFRTGADQINRFRSLPSIIGIIYIAITFLLFVFGPIDYPVRSYVEVSAYVFAVIAVLHVFFGLGSRQLARESSLRISRVVFVSGALLSIVVLFPSTYYYTGKMPWEFMSAIEDQRAAYSSLSSQLAATEGQRGPIIILRALVMPLIWAVIPLGVIYWSRLGWIYRGLLVSTVISSLIFSALRGTDREIADLLIISGGAYAVAVGRKRLARLRSGQVRSSATGFLSRRWRVAILAVLALGVSGSVFVERKEDRMATVKAFCFLNSGACADYTHPLLVGMNDTGRFATSMSVAYITNGYYGLSLALEKPFQSTWGIGHSPALVRIYGVLSGDQSAGTRTFNYRNTDDGWPQEYFWSTMLTSVANDVGFPGAVLIMGVFAWFWGRSWIDAVVAANDSAAIVFCLAMYSVLYFPANLQILQTLEGYSTVIFWIVAWVFFRSRDPIRS